MAERQTIFFSYVEYCFAVTERYRIIDAYKRAPICAFFSLIILWTEKENLYRKYDLKRPLRNKMMLLIKEVDGN